MAQRWGDGEAAGARLHFHFHNKSEEKTMRNVKTAIVEHQSPSMGSRAVGPCWGSGQLGFYTGCYIVETKKGSLAKKIPYCALYGTKT